MASRRCDRSHRYRDSGCRRVDPPVQVDLTLTRFRPVGSTGGDLFAREEVADDVGGAVAVLAVGQETGDIGDVVS